MDFNRTVKIGDVEVGSGRPVFLIAEMSANHGGSKEAALEIVRAAKRAGADAVKLQTYRADTITLDSDKSDFLLPIDSPWKDFKTMHGVYAKAYTPWEWHSDLFKEARSLGLEIFSAPFDETAVDFLEELGAPAYKVASPEITHIPLLRRIARTKKPVILSTGLASGDDLDIALQTLQKEDCRDVVLLKCTSEYPAPPEEMNLETMRDFGRRFGCLYGLSDHTMGSVVSTAAVAMGAAVIEKHFRLNETTGGVDEFFSLSESRFGELVRDVRVVEKAKGSVCYDVPPRQVKNLNARRSLYVAKDIKKGEPLTPENIRCVRPGFGLHPKYYDAVIGKRVVKNLEAGDRLTLEDVEGA